MTSEDIKVLVVDDDALATQSIEIMLEQLGYIVAGEAADGQEALDQTWHLRPDVILMDALMPGMDGISAAQQIQATCPTPIVMLTGHANDQLLGEAAKAGIGAYLSKPATSQDIVRAITIARARFEDTNLLRRLNARLQDEIVQHQETEQALRESEERFTLFMEHIPAAVSIKDLDNRLIYANAQFAAPTGQPPDTLVGHMAEDFTPPGILEKFRRENRIVLSEGRVLERDHVYPGPQGTTYWHTYKFPIYKAGVPAFVGTVSVDVTRRKQAEEQLRTALAEKKLLIKEIHHRVKNNLAIVSSLLSLQSETLQDEQAKIACRETQDRVQAMARVHEQLYRAQNLTQVHLQSYLNDLVQSLQQSYGADHVVITLDISDVTLPVDIAIPCGLIVNELVTNALKYAFPRGAGSDDDEIVVSLHRTDAGTCTLTVSDNGRGLPEDFTIEGANGNETLGMFLVGTFVQQLEGTLTWHGGQGTTWRITFPYREPSPLPQD